MDIASFRCSLLKRPALLVNRICCAQDAGRLNGMLVVVFAIAKEIKNQHKPAWKWRLELHGGFHLPMELFDDYLGTMTPVNCINPDRLEL